MTVCVRPLARNRERTDHKAGSPLQTMAKKPDSDEKVARRLLQELIAWSRISPRRQDECPRVLIAFGEYSVKKLGSAHHSIVRSTHPDNNSEQDRLEIIDRVLDYLQKRGHISEVMTTKANERSVFLSRETLDFIECRTWDLHPKFGKKGKRVATLNHWSRLTAATLLKSV